MPSSPDTSWVLLSDDSVVGHHSQKSKSFTGFFSETLPIRQYVYTFLQEKPSGRITPGGHFPNVLKIVETLRSLVLYSCGVAEHDALLRFHC